MKNQHKVLLLKTLIHSISLWLVVELYYLAIMDQLGTDPVKEVIHTTGIGALNLLLLTLLVSPCAKRFKAPWLQQVRRLLGIYSFAYASLHLFSYAAFELQFDWSLLLSEIIKRPYITVGMVAFCLLIPLTITSLKYYQRKLGKNWQKLHNLIYPIALLVPIHFYWSVKSDVTEPLIYLFSTGLLLWLRKDRIKRFLMVKK